MIRGRSWTGFEAAALQEAMRCSVRDFAAMLGVELTTVANWRSGLSSVTPRSKAQAILDTAFRQRATADDRERFAQIVAEGEEAWRTRHQQPDQRLVAPDKALASHAPNASPHSILSPTSLPPDGQEASLELLSVLARADKLSRSVDPEVIARLRSSTQGLIDNFERLTPASLLPALTKQRAWLETLIDECSDLRQRRELYEISSHTSGLLGYITVGCGNFSLAGAYSHESFELGRYAEDTNLASWARGMQSFCEYYAGRFDKALAYAEDGFALASNQPQSVRLAINGIARSRGKLGDATGVHRAVEDAHQALSRYGSPSGSPSSITLDSYSLAQVTGNAATAYLSLGMPDKVEEYGRVALAEMSEADSRWGRSLILIDLARANVLAENADLDAATNIMLDALDPAMGVPMLQVHRRGLEFVRDATARWGSTRELRTLRDMLTDAPDRHE
ncbi:hypothetical protein ACWF82_32800 [Nocardia sp. NPDC055053]